MVKCSSEDSQNDPKALGVTVCLQKRGSGGETTPQVGLESWAVDLVNMHGRC